jgi:hypothetical protein
MRPAILLLLAVATAVGSRPLMAHHAFSAEFDATKPVTLKGKVTKIEWVNPHCWIHMEVPGGDGNVASWMIEGGAPNALLRRGFTKNTLAVGTEIVVEGFRALDGSTRANGRELTVAASGQKLFMGSSGTGAPVDGRDSTEIRR